MALQTDALIDSHCLPHHNRTLHSPGKKARVCGGPGHSDLHISRELGSHQDSLWLQRLEGQKTRVGLLKREKLRSLLRRTPLGMILLGLPFYALFFWAWMGHFLCE